MILLSQFLEMMSTEKRATRSTLSAYEADVLNFYNFLQHQNVQSITSENVQDYLFTQKHLSPATVGRRLSSLRQFYTFLISIGKTKENPFSCVKKNHCKSKPTFFLTEEEGKRLLQGAKNWEGREGKRLSLLLQIFWLADISVNTLVSLPVDVGIDVLKREKSFLLFQEKGKKDQLVSLTATAFEAFQDYMMVRASFLRHNQNSVWLFPSLSKTGHLTRQRFGQLLKELSLKVGLDSTRLSLYAIRYGIRNFSDL